MAPAMAPQAFLLPGARGSLCALYYAPQPGLASRGDLLVVPPFAEEMNRCRTMVAMQARALSALGFGTLVLDPYGTGESEGEFAEATWAGWRDDLVLGIDWLDRHGQGCRGLWGLRLGAAMAVQLARQRPAIERLLLWQPVFNGKSFYTQFLRIRIAAEMNLPDRVKSTGELRAWSARGDVIEVSGYEIGPAMAAELDAVDLDHEAMVRVGGIDWLEVSTEAAPALLPASVKCIETLQAAGARVSDEAVNGPLFWHVHERELAPALIETTTRRLVAWEAWSGVRSRVGPSAVIDATASSTGQPITFECGEQRLSGFVHRGSASATRGVVIVVAGGPQYRAGAHRQFVQLARKLAGQGWPTLRFDLRGMGDSTGSYVGFEHSETDIRAAIDALQVQQPQLKQMVLIGECESASGILFYAWRDDRVQGAVLVNPWVRTDEGRAQVIVKDYYLDRLRQPEFWSKLRQGRFDVLASLKSLVRVGRDYLRGRLLFARSRADAGEGDIAALPLPQRTAAGLGRFRGQALLLMSGHDYIAREFEEVTSASRAWDGLLDRPNVQRVDIEGADHTFSRRV